MKTVKNQFILILLIFIGIFCFNIFSTIPTLSFFIFDLILCLFLYLIFSHNKYSFLFLLHPIILSISSFLFTKVYLESGDSAAYQDVVFQYINPNTLENNISEVLNFGFDNDIIGFFKYTSLGVAPVFVIPIYFFKNFNDYNYFQLQGVIHVVLSIIGILLAKKWKTFDSKRLYEISIFLILSPSFFDLIGSGITRHILTNFSIFLVFISLFSLKQTITLNKVLWHLFSLLILIISKAPLILPYLVYLIFDYIIINKKITFTRAIIFSLFFIIFSFVLLYFSNTIYSYSENISSETGTFSVITSIPFIGIIFKYLYSIVSPFPWYDFNWLKSNYSGNFILAILHIFSSVFALQLFLIILFRWKEVTSIDLQLKKMIFFFLIMSTSIIFGTTGFHNYLLIFFSIVSPLLFLHQYNYIYVKNIIFLLSLNILILLLKI
jgi:hypothetical protein